MTRKLKCRYCSFEVKAFYTTKAGEHKPGFPALMRHVRDNHTPTYELQRLDEENDDYEYYE